MECLLLAGILVVSAVAVSWLRQQAHFAQMEQSRLWRLYQQDPEFRRRMYEIEREDAARWAAFNQMEHWEEDERSFRCHR